MFTYHRAVTTWGSPHCYRTERKTQGMRVRMLLTYATVVQKLVYYFYFSMLMHFFDVTTRDEYIFYLLRIGEHWLRCHLVM